MGSRGVFNTTGKGLLAYADKTHKMGCFFKMLTSCQNRKTTAEPAGVPKYHLASKHMHTTHHMYIYIYIMYIASHSSIFVA